MSEVSTVKLIYKLQRKSIILWCTDGIKISYSSTSPIDENTIEEIKAHKENLISFLTKRKVNAPYQIPYIFDMHEEQYPLSFAQERLWFLAQLQGQDNYIYNEPIMLYFDTHCNISILKTCINKLVERHACFRTLFKKDENGKPYQMPVSFDKLDMSTFFQETDIEDNSLNNHLAHNVYRCFNLENEMPIRFFLYCLKQSKQFVLNILLHHIITDGNSIGILIKELYDFYNIIFNDGELNLSQPKIQYSDYALWSKEYYKDEIIEKQLEYWKNKLSDFQTLELLKSRPITNSRDSSCVIYDINLDLLDQLKLFSRKNKVTLFVSLLSGFFILLHRYSNQNDLVIGTPISGRKLDQIKDVLGFFINTVALRAKLQNQKVCDFVNYINEIYIEALKCQDTPFEQVVNILNVDRNRESSPIFQVFFAYQKLILSDYDANGKTSHNHASTYAPAKFDITFDFRETQAGLIASVQYKANLYAESTIKRMSKHYVNILSQMIQFSEGSLSEITMLTPDEYETLVYSYNQTDKPFSRDLTLMQLFEAQVKKNPAASALVFDSQQLNYSELNARANQLANYLHHVCYNMAKSKQQLNTLVALCLERSTEMIVAMLAVLKAGWAYVPIDPNFPSERINFILQDTKAKLVITQNQLQPKMHSLADKSTQLIVLDSEAVQIAVNNMSRANLASTNHPTDLAYVIYTSGTTGLPNGVMVEQRGVVNLSEFIINSFGLNSSSRCSQYANYVFDASVYEIFPTLLAGATLYLVPKADQLEFTALIEFFRTSKITKAFLPTAVIKQIACELNKTSIELLHTGGESLAGLKILPKLRLINQYGPTEGTVCCTQAEITQLDDITIGKALPNVKIYILNTELEPVPVGVIGELYLGGVGLARGYLNQPELTQARFINNPFATETDNTHGYNRIYKTGDLVRRLPDGNIEYIERSDFQVKIRGFRIELKEIEAVLSRFPEIIKCLVLAREFNNTKNLIAYYSSDVNLEDRVLRNHMEKYLPDYMLPHMFIFIKNFPLTVSGKIDIKNLPISKADSPTEKYVAPRNEIEKKLVDILCDILPVKNISINKNFFEAGCDSLKAVQIQTKINHVFGIEIKVVDIFSSPFIEKLAKIITTDRVELEEDYSGFGHWSSRPANDEIAIIGYSCNFPMSRSVIEYWENIKAGKECISYLSRDECIKRNVPSEILNHDKYLPYSGVISGYDDFDVTLWGLTEDDLLFIDPQMRLFLTESWKALKSTHYLERSKKLTTGLFVGSGDLEYTNKLLQDTTKKQLLTYFDRSMLACRDYYLNRIAFLLGIHGPILSVDTACSSGIVAVIEACEKLLAGKCDIALAGSINLNSPDNIGYLYYDGMELLSRDGHIRIFDEKGGGIVRSDGVCVVLLKRLADARRDNDPIKAIIKGYGVSNDGARKVGNIYPRVSSLKNCIQKAHENITSGNIGYLECHGMGFKLGELFEFDALKEAFANEACKRGNDKCILGSVKANIGHTGYASGIAGIIKVCCMLENGIFPPQINYTDPYREFDIEHTIFDIIKEKQDWKVGRGKARIAGITSFGIGGTNAHIVLADLPEKNP